MVSPVVLGLSHPDLGPLSRGYPPSSVESPSPSPANGRRVSVAEGDVSGGRNSCMGRPMHQMAAHSVGHMDEGRIPPGGGRWFARWVSATLAFLTGACAHVTPLTDHLLRRAWDLDQGGPV